MIACRSDDNEGVSARQIHANSLRESPAPHPRAPRRAVLGGILTAPQVARAQSPYDAAFAASTKLDADAFYAEHPYRSAGDVLAYIESAPRPAAARLASLRVLRQKIPDVLHRRHEGQDPGQCRRDGQAKAHRGSGEFPGLFGGAHGGEITGRRHAGVRRGQSNSRGRPRASWRAPACRTVCGSSSGWRRTRSRASPKRSDGRTSSSSTTAGVLRARSGAHGGGGARGEGYGGRRGQRRLPGRAGLPRQGRGAGLRLVSKTGALRGRRLGDAVERRSTTRCASTRLACVSTTLRARPS